MEIINYYTETQLIDLSGIDKYKYTIAAAYIHYKETGYLLYCPYGPEAWVELVKWYDYSRAPHSVLIRIGLAAHMCCLTQNSGYIMDARNVMRIHYTEEREDILQAFEWLFQQLV